MMRFCLTNKINALRIPISLELALNPKLKIPKKSCVECKGELAWTFLDKLFEAAAAYGIVILLDMHRMSAVSFGDTPYS
jgi:aryl-phospho-beta-D-glucosidase BglC (GH1 family)